MKNTLLQIIACASVLTLTTSCTPTEQAAVGGAGAGILAGGIASAAGMTPAQSALIGVGAGALTASVVYIVAKHQATERQRQIAEARAARIYQGMPAEKRQQVTKSRYMAVETTKDERIQGEKAVMIYDTQNQELVSNNVYDVKNTPSVGSTAKFDTYNATFVGA